MWFKNRRAKWRKQQREEQERNRRLQQDRTHPQQRHHDEDSSDRSTGILANLSSGLQQEYRANERSDLHA